MSLGVEGQPIPSCLPKAIPHKAHDSDVEPDADGPATLPR